MYRVLINRPNMPVSRVIVMTAEEFTKLVGFFLTLDRGRPISVDGAYTDQQLRAFDEVMYSYGEVVFRVKALSDRPYYRIDE